MVHTLTREEIHEILSNITFAPSCVDMKWIWELRPCPGEVQNDITEGWLVRTSFVRPDRDTGEVRRGMGAWHHIPLDSSASGIVKRAFVAAKAILEHELMESFRYHGVRIFDPHHTVDDLMAAAEHARLPGGFF